jgi:hypothetical protein
MGGHVVNRREFGGLSTLGLASGLLGWGAAAAAATSPTAPWDPERPLTRLGKPLRVQPVFMYTTYQRREKTSWKSWSGINTPEAADDEARRIRQELAALATRLDFPAEILPLAKVTSVEEAQKVHQTDYDVVLVYPATGSGTVLQACFPPKPDKDAIVFVRHRSGPIYYWYEALSTRFLKKGTPQERSGNSAANHGGVTVDDAVVDDYAEVAWRLRALFGLKNFIGQRILALGGPGGKYDAEAPSVARERYRLQILDVSYDELAKSLAAARADRARVDQANTWTDRYLALPGTTLAAPRHFVANAFLLYGVFKAWMERLEAPALTVNGCMGRILPVAETTPCMTLSWLNDEGLLGFCESDFVIIPAGILLRFIAGRPVFLHNSTFPHQRMVTCAHCSAPRRMDGSKYEPVRVMTHYESDFGAAPKVDMALNQTVTFIDPEYSTARWLGFKGTIRANPCHEICRTQQDVEIEGDWRRLVPEARDSHWMMVYGDWLKEIGYAARKIGIQWEPLS